MQIESVKFITSFADSATYAKCVYPAEICFAGRSNVGKSTFINTLCGQKIAKTSSTPGRTRLINIFEINGGAFNIVDLPGYGYAKAPKSQVEKWQSLIEGYFQSSKSLKQVFVLVDCRVLSTLDSQMLNYLYYYQIPFCVLATKSDKLTVQALTKQVSELAAFLKIGKDNIVPVSDKGTGRDKVLQKIGSVIGV